MRYLFLILLWQNLLFSYGSLAIDEKQGNAWGVSWDYSNQKLADKRALDECKKKSKNCNIVIRTDNSCAAYAVDRTKGSTIYGWQKSNTMNSAKQGALSWCIKKGGRDCVSRVWGCDNFQKKKLNTNILDTNISNAKTSNNTNIQNNSINSTAKTKQKIQASLLMLIDISGSMNDNGKLNSAKKAAIEGAKVAVGEYTEIAILAFTGDCSTPIKRKLDFTTDLNKIITFINSLKAIGGTPLGNALKIANHYLSNYKATSSKTQMVLLLADGDDNCKNVNRVMNRLRSKGIIFRHEAVGLGIDSSSNAERDLKSIAKKSGGSYHHTNNPKKLTSIFLESIETMQILDMLGTFGKVSSKKAQGNKTNSNDSMNSILNTFE